MTAKYNFLNPWKKVHGSMDPKWNQNSKKLKTAFYRSLTRWAGCTKYISYNHIKNDGKTWISKEFCWSAASLVAVFKEIFKSSLRTWKELEPVLTFQFILSFFSNGRVERVGRVGRMSKFTVDADWKIFILTYGRVMLLFEHVLQWTDDALQA